MHLNFRGGVNYLLRVDISAYDYDNVIIGTGSTSTSYTDKFEIRA